MHIQTGGRQATRTRAVGSQPVRPLPAARNNEINPPIRTSQLTQPLHRVGNTAPVFWDQCTMATIALAQLWPRADPVGNGALWPMRVTNPTAPAIRGKTGAAKDGMGMPGCGGYMQANCPCETAHIG